MTDYVSVAFKGLKAPVRLLLTLGLPQTSVIKGIGSFLWIEAWSQRDGVGKHDIYRSQTILKPKTVRCGL